MQRLLLLTGLLATGLLHAQTPPQMEWQRCYGGTEDDIGYSIGITSDGGYVFAGCAGSINGDIAPKTSDMLHGGKCDYWVARTNSKGDILFKRLLDGTESDVARKVVQLPSGEFLVAGSTASNDIDVDCNQGDFDVWIVKLSATGDVIWKKCYGGPGYEDFGSMVLTPDGGFAFCAGTSSNSGQVSGNQGSSDFWVVKADASGNVQWARCFGGSGYEKAFGIDLTADGGFVVCGFTGSQDKQVLCNHSSDFDGWVVRLDGSGNLLWSKCYGGTLLESLYSVAVLSDGSLLLGGYTTSSDGDLNINYGGDDAWLLRTSENGQVLWSSVYGGPADEAFSKVLQGSAGQLIAAGYSRSASGHLPANYGDWDCWLMLTDDNGIVQFSKNYGGQLADVCYDVQLTGDGGLALMGYSASTDTLHDVSGNHGKKDYWLLKLSSLTTLSPLPYTPVIRISPNPANDAVVIYLGAESISARVTVTDLFGRPVFESDLAGSTLSVTTGSWASGTYQVVVRQDNHVYASLLLKQ
ncbi:MAG: T9SS type A sorting domain-containing protein [Chitinophagales bacterium]|nr:T9SS type A sorting domain-containing protein [Chitinophagales bacterium]